MSSATERILFIRCVPQPLALAALVELRRARPGAHIDVLSNNAAGPAITASGVADAVVLYPAAAYGVLPAGPRLIRSLRRRRYDVVVVPFTRRGRAAFWNVARLALTLGGTQTVWHDLEQSGASTWSPLSWRGWWSEQPLPARVRLGVLRAVKAPALIGAYAVSMCVLMVLALVLVPLVWLKPGAPIESGGGR